MSSADAIVEARHLELSFPVGRGLVRGDGAERVRAVDDVSFELREGETLGLVGESGCGKTTLARCVLRLAEPTGGELRFRGRDVAHARRSALAPLRREVQMVFQDPFASLNPRKRVDRIVAAPLRLRGASRSRAAAEIPDLLARVGLEPGDARRFPHEFSGGQRQRIGIARALAPEPRLVLLDEPVSALDVSIRAQIVNLLDDLQDELGLAYLFVAHDLSLVRHVSDRIAVMYLGKLVEVASADELDAKPIHPYTQALLAAVPVPDPRENRARERVVLEGEPPSASAPPPGCRFHTRCPRATEVCRTVEPPLTEYANGHLAACHHPASVSAAEIAAARRSEASPTAAGAETPRAPGADRTAANH